MESIRCDREGSVLIVHMSRGRANALTAAMVEDLHRAVDEAEWQAAVRAVVLASDSPRIFCGGFDVSEVFSYDRPTMAEFFKRFGDLFERLRTLPKPVVGALSGHAYAGGAILALACDVRIMGEGASLALNEVDLGVVLPTHMVRAMAANASTEVMRSLLLSGEAIAATRALAAGLVSEVAPAVDVLPVALTRARLLGEKPAHAFAEHKRVLDAVGPRPAGDEYEREIAHVVDVWFGEEATARRQALIEKLAKKG
jgi:enoyl-CoA hydratase/carnithine racemase